MPRDWVRRKACVCMCELGWHSLCSALQARRAASAFTFYPTETLPASRAHTPLFFRHHRTAFLFLVTFLVVRLISFACWVACSAFRHRLEIIEIGIKKYNAKRQNSAFWRMPKSKVRKVEKKLHEVKIHQINSFICWARLYFKIEQVRGEQYDFCSPLSQTKFFKCKLH